ncbi:hypothetical protein [Shimia sp.]|uniref:hypothetical protein n=1 Tax=Shimia sp. TaxID=1954381 RepID=UPI003B8C11F8
MQLTPEQKLAALAHRFYSDVEWTPKPGDYYTTSRADLEVYQILSVSEATVRTSYVPRSAVSTWPKAEFLAKDFGLKRVWVPDWVLTETPTSAGVELIRQERLRQITEEKWSLDHDDQHTDETLSLVAALYAAPHPLFSMEIDRDHGRAVEISFVDPWPATWDEDWDGRLRHNRMRQLAIAGALCGAELDRLMREERNDG